MTEYNFQPSTYSPTFRSNEPVLHLKDGDSVFTNLLDAHGYDPQGKRLVEFSNPLVGPFYVDGLLPGDTLSVTLDEVKPASMQGWSYIYPTSATIDPPLFATIPTERKMINWDLDMVNGMAHISSPSVDQSRLEIPLKPMIGCLGVAPALSQAITSYASGNFGGNMDCPLLTSGCRMDFPVFVEGGLLYIGDCHAAQSHGEISGAAIEIPGVVRFTVHNRKGETIAWPRGENHGEIFTMGTGRPLDVALQRATSEMLRWLVQGFDMDLETASLWMSQLVHYVISNAVNEQATVACVLPNSFQKPSKSS